MLPDNLSCRQARSLPAGRWQQLDSGEKQARHVICLRKQHDVRAIWMLELKSLRSTHIRNQIASLRTSDIPPPWIEHFSHLLDVAVPSEKSLSPWARSGRITRTCSHAATCLLAIFVHQHHTAILPPWLSEIRRIMMLSRRKSTPRFPVAHNHP